MLQSEINVTPLVDVCLVLLIIFMVVLPSMVNGVVALPQTNSNDQIETRSLPITVKADGTVYLNTSVVRRDEVESALARLHAAEPSRSIAVRGDKRVRYGEVLAVIAACRAAGWEDVTLVGQRRAGA